MTIETTEAGDTQVSRKAVAQIGGVASLPSVLLIVILQMIGPQNEEALREAGQDIAANTAVLASLSAEWKAVSEDIGELKGDLKRSAEALGELSGDVREVNGSRFTRAMGSEMELRFAGEVRDLWREVGEIKQRTAGLEAVRP
jgi:hypothetical protein